MIYILQKDLPDAKAGTKFSLTGGPNPETMVFNSLIDEPEFIGQQPIRYCYRQIYNVDLWFIPEEDHEVKLAIDVLVKNGWAMFYENKAAKEPERMLSVTQKDWEVSKAKELLESRGWTFNIKDLYVYMSTIYEYTEQDMRACFNAAKGRRCNGRDGKDWAMIDQFTVYEDYINSLNKK